MKRFVSTVLTLVCAMSAFSPPAFAAGATPASAAADSSCTTLWIAIIGGVGIGAILITVAVLARKNKGN